MRRAGRWWAGWMLVGGLGAGADGVAAADRPPAEILREIDEFRAEEGDPARDNDRAYVAAFWKRQHARFAHRAALIGELYRVDPGNPRVARLLPVRWRALSGRLMGSDGTEDVAALLAEADAVRARTSDPELEVAAAYLRAWIVGDPQGRPGAAADAAGRARAVDDFIAFAPQDPRGADLLRLLALDHRADPARQREIYRRIVRDYPTSPEADAAAGLLAKSEAVGKPFDLTFRDATSGAEVATRTMRGKVIVVDFWATWCGACIADLPRMKELHARYHPRGVEFIGVSLDYPAPAGGIDKVRAFVARHALPWPQYFQGDGFDSAFSTAMGVAAAPTIFVVDRAGNLASVDAGADLAAVIEAQLPRDR